jgi:hypothetical protein
VLLACRLAQASTHRATLARFLSSKAPTGAKPSASRGPKDADALLRSGGSLESLLRPVSPAPKLSSHQAIYSPPREYFPRALASS